MVLTSLLPETFSPNKAGLVFGDQRLSYADFDSEARRRALRFVAAGVHPGDRVALHFSNCTELALSCYACFYAGAIAVPLNPRMKAPELGYQIQHSGASFYLGQERPFREIERVRPRLPGIHRFFVDGDTFELRPRHLAQAKLPEITGDQVAAILYTSGSTARPKGVVHTLRSLQHAASGFGITRDDVVLLMTPMVHSAAFMALLAAVNAGATAVIVEHFNADAVLNALARHRATYLIGMPVMYHALIAAQRTRPRDLSSALRCAAGGDAVPPALKNEFGRCFRRPLYEAFGTTETGPIAANWHTAPDRVGSFGRALPGVEISVVDRNGDLVSAGSEGEMIVRSPGTMLGYWSDSAATEGALKGGWYYTGDIVRQDADGYFWFAGRKKDIIVVGGANISPNEVEAALYEHPGVREAAVIGTPDGIWGERIVAFIKQRPRQIVAADELLAFLAARLHPYKLPDEILFVEELPTSAAGKLLRRSLRADYVAGWVETVEVSRSLGTRQG